MHGEDIWLDNGIDDAVWVPIFIERYATQQVPNDYLKIILIYISVRQFAE